MAKSTKTYEERIRALEKKEQESIEATKKLIAQRKELEKEKEVKVKESKKNEPQAHLSDWRSGGNQFLAVRLRRRFTKADDFLKGRKQTGSFSQKRCRKN